MGITIELFMSKLQFYRDKYQSAVYPRKVSIQEAGYASIRGLI